ncbi:hypothetical protein [Streptomyces sp. NPDC090036]
MVDDRLAIEDDVLAQGERGLGDLRESGGEELAVAGLQEHVSGCGEDEEP